MKFLLSILTGVILLASACNGKNETQKLDRLNQNKETKEVSSGNENKDELFNNTPPENNADSFKIPALQTADQVKQKKQPAGQPTTNPDWDKKIIKTASVNLEVKDYNSFYTSLREKVKSMGGYIAQEEQAQSDYKIENSMIIKVPVDQFDNAVVQLTGNAQKINERKITSQDVTTEVVDTKSRMEAKKQVRQRYMELLGQAKNMQDILSVQSEINGIQEEIESAAGRIEYLTHSSVFSTINLTYYQVLNSSAKDAEGIKNPSFGEKVKDGLKTGWEIISNLIVVLITLWPLLLGSLVAFILYKRFRGQKAKA
ncbi:MAG: DUF4349 domain-containing protein [Bacteroidota bacterium]|nr:DUF4349 domain-containing protein [Bacteroidota bacterium]